MINKKQVFERIFQVIEKAETNDKTSKVFDATIIILIVINILAVILQSFQELSIRYDSFFTRLEFISVIIFTIEYILRISTSNLKYPTKTKFKATIRYLFSFMALIDLFAILPFYLPMFMAIDLRFLRILRVTRILRVLKIQRYNNSLKMINSVIQRRKEDLLITLFITFLLLLLASSVMYYIENKSQPDSFPNIVASFWWAIATLTTVGYGDVYPVTVLGKILSGVIALLGIGIVALPTGIISSGFVEEMEKKIKEQEEKDGKKKEKIFCPYCGEKLK